MSSLIRRMQKRALKARDKWNYEQPTITLKDGGYRTLRPTKGWFTMSMRRINAQAKMARIFGA